MDSPKDVQKTQDTLKFLDYQTLKSNAFGDNRLADRIYRRAERIASASILLTNHLDSGEPLKYSIRSSSIELLSNIMSVKDEMRSPNSHETHVLRLTIRKFISLIRLLAISGHASYQNCEIVIEALDELLVFIVSARKSNLSESASINRSDLIESGILEIPNGAMRSDTSVVTPNVSTNNGDHVVTKESDKSQVLDARAQSILEVLRSQGELGIRGISLNLPEYSEKMIQRELLDLVKLGRVRKTGLKRWSRYSYLDI
jgi:hypothetical protein